MKKFLLLSFFVLAICTVNAQMHNTLPPEAADFYHRAMQKVKPEVAVYIVKTASTISGNNIDTDSLCSRMKSTSLLKNVDESGCQTIALLILIRCVMNADADLKQKVLKMQQNDNSDKNYEETADLINRKSNLAIQVKSLLAAVNDENIALKDLK